ncbi:MAG: SDR family oxidoreductase [Microthrixaceae bacterium]
MDRERLDSLFDLTGRTAVVTGGTRGIGLAIAEGLVCSGANVVVASRKADACAAAAEHLTRLGRGAGVHDGGGDAIGVPAHMGDLDALDAVVDAAVGRFGGVDILVNNAANALAQPMGGFTPEAWSKSFDVNARGPMFLLQAAVPFLSQSEHAAVLNVVSVGAFLFSAHVSIYAAGKAALMSFTRSMAAELAHAGIRVNALAPGPVDTDMVAATGPEGRAAMAGSNLQRRIASPDELVGAALLLVSDAGTFITGQVVVVDGGTTPH